MDQVLSNKYEVIKELGKGGMGEVLLVRDLHLNRLAAAKRMPEEHQRVESFRNEMELLRELEHPALPSVYDFFQEGNWFYLIMEYVDGITLEQYLQRSGKVPVELAVQWAIELTEVLEYLHSRRPMILYRDLKPANIMIRPGGRIKLIDLGGCLKNSYGSRREGGSLGTLGYSAPKQCLESPQSGCDIYSLGAVLHEMLTGIRPLSAAYERRPIREYDRSFPAKLEQIILKCTREDAKERYHSMEQLREALLLYARGGRWGRICWGFGNGLNICLWFLFAGEAVIPFVYGVPEDQIPFPYLYRPSVFLAAAMLFRQIVFRKKRNVIKCIEKSIQATEKKFVGL